MSLLWPLLLPQPPLTDNVYSPRARLQTAQSAQGIGWGWQVASRDTGVKKPGGQSWPRMALQGLRNGATFPLPGVLELSSPAYMHHHSECLSPPKMPL